MEPQTLSQLALDKDEDDSRFGEESNEAGWLLHQYLKEKGLGK